MKYNYKLIERGKETIRRNFGKEVEIYVFPAIDNLSKGSCH